VTLEQIIHEVTGRCDGPETDFVLIFRVNELVSAGRIDAYAGANAIYMILMDRGHTLTS